MTGAPVKGVNPLVNYVRVKQPAGAKQELAGNFTDAFSKASGHNGMQEMRLPDDVSARDTSKSGANVRPVKTQTDKAEPVKKAKPEETQAVGMEAQDAQDAVTQAGEKLVEKVAEELGITVEEVRQAMQEMGLAITDLFDPELMTQLVLNLEEADMLSLMTDENLYGSLQNILGEISQTVQQLANDLGIAPEELARVLEQVKAKEQPPEEYGKEPSPTAEDKPQLPEEQKDYKVTLEQNGETVEITVNKEEHGRTESVQTETEELPTQHVEEKIQKSGETGTQKQETSSQNGGENGQTQTNLLVEHLLNRENPVRTEAVFEASMTQHTADTQDIMNQIMDYMKVQVKADMTQMEIQLHPASLGTVNINISSKEGVITAQFLTQNEAVKAAVESQIVQLKNSFEEQGLKVEAVEVAVDSRQFDRSLNGNESGREQEREGKKKGVRRINLNDPNPEEEHLDDAEQIAVEMMASDGNTVDYTV